MVVNPKLAPSIFGCTAGDTAPAAINTLLGDTSTRSGKAGSFPTGSCVNVTVTPPAGAGLLRTIGKLTNRFGATVRPGVNVIVPGPETVMVEDVSAKFGRLLARITVVPTDFEVTLTPTEEEFPGMNTVAGTVATAVLSELMLIVNPLAGAGEDKVKVRFFVVLKSIA